MQTGRDEGRRARIYMEMTSEQIESTYMAGIDTSACEWHLLLMFNPGHAERIEELRTDFYELRKTRPEINFQEFIKEKNGQPNA